jgi:hypothetical protein
MTGTDKIISEFLDEIGQRADRDFKGQSHEAFLAWYIEAEFGDVKWRFTDDVNDGGIDAVVWLPDESPSVMIIQSKYSKRFGGSKLPAKAYSEGSRVLG